jgi:hypothetical protein
MEPIMPLRLNVGLSQKVGQPDYGSLGASCHLEVELDPSLALNDLSTLKQRIRHLHGICREAVQMELAHRQRAPLGSDRSGDSTEEPSGEETSADQPSATPAARASQRQMDYLLQLARQVPAVGVAGLPRLVQHLFQKVAAATASRQGLAR